MPPADGHYQLIFILFVVELQPAIDLDNQNVDVEWCQPGGVVPVALITMTALEHCGHHPADKGLASKYFECWQTLIMCHNFRCQVFIAEASGQVVVYHLVTGGESGQKEETDSLK